MLLSHTNTRGKDLFEIQHFIRESAVDDFSPSVQPLAEARQWAGEGKDGGGVDTGRLMRFSKQHSHYHPT